MMKRRYRVILALVLVFTFMPSRQALSLTRSEEEAMNYFLKGALMENWNEQTYAYTYYKAAIDKCPECGRVKLALARVALTLGKFKEVKDYTTALLDSGMYVEDAAIFLAEASYRTGDLAGSAASIENIADELSVGRKIRVLTFLARIYLELKETDKAASTLERIVKEDPDNVIANYRLGLIYANRGDTSDAVDRFETVLRRDPAFQDVPMLLSSILIGEGSTRRAKEVLVSAFEANPQDSDVRERLFQMINEEGDFELGISILEPFFKRDELGPELLVSLGRFYYELGRKEEALAVYKSLMDKTEERPALLRILADLEFGLGNLKNAAGYLSKLIDKEPGKFTNYTGVLLLSHNLAGRPSKDEQRPTIAPEDSAKYIDAAASLVDSSSASENYLMGVVLNEAGDSERALDYLEVAGSLKPEDKKISLELIKTYEESGRYSEALERIRRLYENDSEDPTINNYYGYLLALNDEKLDFAEELLAKALDADPDNGYYLDSLGWIKYRKGRFQEALDILLKAASSVEDDPTIWEHIGDTYVKIGSIERAEEAYRKSIKLDPGSSKIIEKLRELSEYKPDENDDER